MKYPIYHLIDRVNSTKKYKHLSIHQKINYKSYLSVKHLIPYVKFNIYNQQFSSHYLNND
jgi:hypothetical protein